METLVNKYNFPLINCKKEYMDLRLKLESSFLLFFAYDETAKAEDVADWFDFLKELESKFGPYMKVVLFSNKSEVKLLEVLKREDEKDISSIGFPRAVICHPHLSEPNLLTDFEPFELFQAVQEYSQFYKESFAKEKEVVFERIKKILSSYPIVVFIKGTPHDPFCKFSRSFIEILKQTGIKYKSFDIFKDESLRNYLRLFSGWKTYPQMYINSKIIGGLDVVKNLVDKGEFLKMVPLECQREGVIAHIEKFLKYNALVLFAEGTPGKFNNKTSEEAHQILKDNKLTVEIFDVLKDEMTADLIKEKFKCQTFPQLFLFEKLLGGVEFLKQISSENKIFDFVKLFLIIFYRFLFHW